MADQAVNIVEVSFRRFADCRKGPESCMTLTATTWLRWLRSIFGLENSNPVMLRYRIGGRSKTERHPRKVPLFPISQELGFSSLLVMQARGHFFHRILMAGPAGLWPFVNGYFALMRRRPGLGRAHLCRKYQNGGTHCSKKK
jgi:hypothetical protein